MPEIASVFRSAEGEARSRAAYDAVLAHWPVDYQERDLATRFGPTHVVASGLDGAMPLILLHGQDSSATSWIHNIGALSQSFRVYAVDTIGDIGKSRPTRMPGSREDYACWLLNVLDQLEIQKADLAGLSYGGFLAANLAMAHPERVRRMVLLAPGIPNLGAPTWKWASCGMPMMVLPSRPAIRWFINGASTTGYSASDPVYEQMIVGMTSIKKVSFMRPVIADEELKRMQVPTLLLLGEHEIMYAPEKALERAACLIPGIQVQLVGNAGHMLNGDQPGAVSKYICDFLCGGDRPGQ